MRTLIGDTDEESGGSDDEQDILLPLEEEDFLEIGAADPIGSMYNLIHEEGNFDIVAGIDLLRHRDVSSDSEDDILSTRAIHPRLMFADGTYRYDEYEDCEEESDSDENDDEVDYSRLFYDDPMKEVCKPLRPDIQVKSKKSQIVVDVQFHPRCDLLAAATFDATFCYKLSNESDEPVHCYLDRFCSYGKILFTENGENVIITRRDNSVTIIDTEKFEIKNYWMAKNDNALHSVNTIDNNLFATGDSNGTLKVYDIRRRSSVYKSNCVDGTLNAVAAHGDGRTLLAASSNGFLTVFDLRKRNIREKSRPYDCEFTSMSLFRNDSRVAAGSSDGSIHIFTWGQFTAHSDIAFNQPDSINSIVPIGDLNVITGCDDGAIRSLKFYPHCNIGVIGRHSNRGVQGLSVSSDQTAVASCTNENVIKIWDLQSTFKKNNDNSTQGGHMDNLSNISISEDDDS